MTIHKGLKEGAWASMSFCLQMGNIGAEVSRAFKWKDKNNDNLSYSAFERALELIELTAENAKSLSVRREVLRLKEYFIYAFMFEKNSILYEKEKNYLNKYLFSFTMLKRE